MKAKKAMDKRDPKAAEALAREFSGILRCQLGTDKVREIVRRNKADNEPGICHSHDFCDANMVMHTAQEDLGLNLDIGGDTPESRKDVDLWGQAWDLAMANAFYLSSVWKEEFDDSYAVPAEILALVDAGEVEDLSWHNDSSPSFGLVNEETEVDLRIWVAHPDAERREFPRPRFNVCLSTLEQFIETDDVNEAIRVLREQLVIFRRGEFKNVRSVPCDECHKVTPTLCAFENAQVCPGCFDALSKKHGYSD